MGRAAHQHIVIETGEDAVGIATFRWSGLMNDGGADQWMAKSKLPQWICYQKAR